MSVSDSLLHPVWLKLPWVGRGAGAPQQRREAPLREARSPETRSREAQPRRNGRLRWRETAEPALTLTGPLAPPTAVARSLSPRIAQVPPWLISLAVHLAGVILLSLWIVPGPQGHLPRVLTLASPDVAEISALASLPALEMEVAEPSGEMSRFVGPLAAEMIPVETDLAIDSMALEVGPTAAPGVSIDDLLAAGETGAKGSADGLPGAEFFGVQAVGRSFVFVVDRSNSMRQGKLDAAKEELLYSIRRLSQVQSFYVIFFSGDTVPMSLNESGEPAVEPVAATNENIQKLEAWVETVDVDPWTDPSEAMRLAIAMQPDAIYLLSDGRFTDRGETIRFLKKANYVRDEGKRRPKVVIHTVGFYQRDGEPTLKSIARAYGGTYRFVAPPK